MCLPPVFVRPIYLREIGFQETGLTNHCRERLEKRWGGCVHIHIRNGRASRLGGSQATGRELD